MFNKQSIWSKYKKYEEMYLELGISCISWIFVELSLGFEKGICTKKSIEICQASGISLMSEILSNLH